VSLRFEHSASISSSCKNVYSNYYSNVSIASLAHNRIALICYRTNIFIKRISIIKLTCTLNEANLDNKVKKVEKLYLRHDN